MAFLKINGFHTSNSGRAEGIGDFLREVDAAGVPFFAYCADGTTSLLDAQTIMRRSGVPHHAVYRLTQFPDNQGGSDVPNYSEAPEEAAAKQWNSFRDRWPVELDRELIFGESINELRKDVEWADWIGYFCYHTALLALNDGFKWCGPGYSSGTPDEGSWETPGMLKFLNLCQEYPERIAVALHEFSLSAVDIWNGNGHLIGRFQQLMESCRVHNIQPPSIFFTEWGWAEREIPKTEIALQHILEVGKLYAQYPSIKGAAIWALDGGWGDLAQKTAALIDPLERLLIATRFPDPVPDTSIPAKKSPGESSREYHREYLVAPQDATLEEWLAICRQGYALKQTVGFSYDDAGIGDLARKTAILYDIPEEERQEYINWYDKNYPHTNVSFRNKPPAQ